MSKVIMCNPKYEHNVGATLRNCSCYGVEELYWTGERVNFDDRKDRIPREERMKGYRDVKWQRTQRPFDLIGDCVPVAIEVRDNAECLVDFVHPEKAVYVFGPEDGSIPKPLLYLCHRFVYIPTKFCLNLSNAIGVVLYDRAVKYKQLYHPKDTIDTRDTPDLNKIGWDGR